MPLGRGLRHVIVFCVSVLDGTSGRSQARWPRRPAAAETPFIGAAMDRHIGRSAPRRKCGKPLGNPSPELETHEQHRNGLPTDFLRCSRIERPQSQTNRTRHDLENAEPVRILESPLSPRIHLSFDERETGVSHFLGRRKRDRPSNQGIQPNDCFRCNIWRRPKRWPRFRPAAPLRPHPKKRNAPSEDTVASPTSGDGMNN